MKKKDDVIYSELTEKQPPKSVLDAAMVELKKNRKSKRKNLRWLIPALSGTVAVVLLCVFLIPQIIGSFGGTKSNSESSFYGTADEMNGSIAAPSNSENPLFYIDLPTVSSDSPTSEASGDKGGGFSVQSGILNCLNYSFYDYNGITVVYAELSQPLNAREPDFTSDIDALSLTADCFRESDNIYVFFTYSNRNFLISVYSQSEETVKEILEKISK